ncbi:MAG: hypothetical protein JO359_04575 [Candidatus Eremiobacteraeota bacterium]|nr:hypothetical protein [Candidatus Eremiobacteraeota bacterium]
MATMTITAASVTVSGSTVTGSQISADYKESAVACPFPLIPENVNTFAFNNGTLTGTSLAVGYTANPSNSPPDIAALVGTVSGNTINATITIKRNDGLAAPIEWTFTIPQVLTLGGS